MHTDILILILWAVVTLVAVWMMNIIGSIIAKWFAEELKKVNEGKEDK